MKKVLVTGAGGFIGSNLCEYLVGTGARVKAFVHYNSQNSWGWLDRSPLAKEMEIVSGDLRDSDSVFRAVENNVDAIYHLGALIGIPYSYESPLAYIRTNIEGTYNILEAGRRKNVERILVTSTSEVYGSALYVPIDEKHPLQPQSPYSASKISADNISLSYHLSFNTPVVVARPFNTYGPRQSARAIIPTIATQMISKKQVIKLGNLDPLRDLTFVEDTASAIVEIAKTEAFIGQTVNIGTGEMFSVRDLFEKLKVITRSEAIVEEDAQRIRPEKSEVHRLQSNNTKLRTKTSWKPKYDLDTGLRKTVDWLTNHLSFYKPDIYNV